MLNKESRAGRERLTLKCLAAIDRRPRSVKYSAALFRQLVDSRRRVTRVRQWRSAPAQVVAHNSAAHPSCLSSCTRSPRPPGRRPPRAWSPASGGTQTASRSTRQPRSLERRVHAKVSSSTTQPRLPQAPNSTQLPLPYHAPTTGVWRGATWEGKRVVPRGGSSRQRFARSTLGPPAHAGSAPCSRPRVAVTAPCCPATHGKARRAGGSQAA
jgi:hypothetical protein